MNMGWNHRLVKMEDGDDSFYQIHEVYYDENDKVQGYTKNGVTVGGSSVEGVRWVLKKMLEALDKDILDYKE